jgi:hypothetical protein
MRPRTRLRIQFPILFLFTPIHVPPTTAQNIQRHTPTLRKPQQNQLRIRTPLRILRQLLLAIRGADFRRPAPDAFGTSGIGAVGWVDDVLVATCRRCVGRGEVTTYELGEGTEMAGVAGVGTAEDEGVVGLAVCGVEGV